MWLSEVCESFIVSWQVVQQNSSDSSCIYIENSKDWDLTMLAKAILYTSILYTIFPSGCLDSDKNKLCSSFGKLVLLLLGRISCHRRSYLQPCFHKRNPSCKYRSHYLNGNFYCKNCLRVFSAMEEKTEVFDEIFLDSQDKFLRSFNFCRSLLH